MLLVQRGKLAIGSLGVDDIPAMHELERAAWPPPLQASEQTIARRASLGHTFLGARLDGRLVGDVCFVLTRLDPTAADNLLHNFAEFSSLERTTPVNSAFVYNLCIHPEYRGQWVVRNLMREGVQFLCRSGCRYLVAHGRCPSYSGSNGGGANHVNFNSKFRDAIEEWRATGVKPADRTLTLDPVLRFYKRVLDCEFLYLKPDFLPADTASGGYGVIFVKALGD